MSKKIRLWTLLSNLTDVRDTFGRRYSLASIISLVLTGYLCGCNSLISVARFGRSLSRNRRKKLGFEKNTPCNATLGNVLMTVDMHEVERALRAFVTGSSKVSNLAVAMDGKRLRGSKRINKEPGAHLLSLFEANLHGVLGQMRMNKGTNEITAALSLLRETPLDGLVITGDAMFAQKEICRQILKGNGDYLFVVKDNQTDLKQQIQDCFIEDFSPLGKEKLPAAKNWDSQHL